MASHNIIAIECDRCGECEQFNSENEPSDKGWAIAIDGLIDAMPDLCPECRVAALAWMRCEKKTDDSPAPSGGEEVGR